MMHNRILLKGFLCGTCLLFFFCTENEDIFEPMDHPSLKIDGQNPLVFNESTSTLSLTISNTGSGGIDWNASTDKDWLKIVPATGTATGTAQSISVQVNKSGLSSGSYSGSITVSSDWGNPVINVQMKVATSMVNGRWRNNFQIDTMPFIAYTQLTQNGTALTGTFEFDDGSGYQNIGSGSYINGKSIKIYFLIGSYTCYFSGTVSNNYQSMSGGLYLQQQYWSSWSATKTDILKLTDSPYNDIPVVEKLQKLIEKSTDR